MTDTDVSMEYVVNVLNSARAEKGLPPVIVQKEVNDE